MYQDFNSDKFRIDPGAKACRADKPVDAHDLQRLHRTASLELSQQIKEMLVRVGRYLGDLAESRRAIR